MEKVLLAAAICTKNGKAIISRQFVEMTRSRIEGLLSAFPKLMTSGSSVKQHTFVETESVRYVYQPLEKLYMLLITTKHSNILEDLETLRLFSRVIPEYCRAMEESEIGEHAFELIFAFDEIVALGYRENVNLAQIRTFTEMDSHEEKVFQAVRQGKLHKNDTQYSNILGITLISQLIMIFVHLKTEEKITLTAGRDGGLQNMEIRGIVLLRISDSQFAQIKLAVENNDDKGFQIQTHPNVDKKSFAQDNILVLKQAGKSFPTNSDIGLLRWRMQTTDESLMPLSSIPGGPVVGEIDGEYHYNHKQSTLDWQVPVIDASNKSGSMEFSIAGQPGDFFPVTVSFFSSKTYCDLKIISVSQVQGGEPVKFSQEVQFTVDKYEFV
ncbi:predicted protein [Nematostella vectensis]|uniref:Coatomer subunit delta n=1 Tax=Nematostella vectensis TaxID=45351 RepID=A7T498_NEMVE|nr:predicted protein [Nematostella vectensis]|eukprot:XP_001621314.1 hypothetical protein NEMVEDRAFT_v1g222121 [Nematostella vectensis]